MSAPQTEHDKLVARLHEIGGCAMLPQALDGPAEVLAKSWGCPKEAIIAGMRVALAWRPQTERGQDDLVARLKAESVYANAGSVTARDRRTAALLLEAAAALKSPSPSVERATIERCAKVCDKIANLTREDDAFGHGYRASAQNCASGVRALRPTSGDEPQTDGELVPRTVDLAQAAELVQWLRGEAKLCGSEPRRDRFYLCANVIAECYEPALEAALARDTKRAAE